MSHEANAGQPEAAPTDGESTAPSDAEDSAHEPSQVSQALKEPVPGAGPLLDFEEGQALESHDRQHAGPGGEPPCPRCGTTMLRSVERHRAPRSDESPFRIRLVCGAADCGAWTAYNW